MGFDSIYQDWKEEGLFMISLDLHHSKPESNEKPSTRGAISVDCLTWISASLY